jgi:uncharacterized protein YdaU (DUF1376 family)
MHYYNFNIGDYASHTRHLTLMEDLAYRRLLDLYYLHERPLNVDATLVAKQIGMRDESETVRDVLNEFFEGTDEGYKNPRADREIAHFHAKIEQASRAGKASAERRFNGRSTDRPTDVQPNKKQETVNSRERAKRGTRLPEDWEPTEEQVAFCRSERPDLNPKSTADRFRDYWIAQPGARGVKTDWDATWRNWVRNENAAKVKPAAEPMRRVL